MTISSPERLSIPCTRPGSSRGSAPPSRRVRPHAPRRAPRLRPPSDPARPTRQRPWLPSTRSALRAAGSSRSPAPTRRPLPAGATTKRPRKGAVCSSRGCRAWATRRKIVRERRSPPRNACRLRSRPMGPRPSSRTRSFARHSGRTQDGASCPSSTSAPGRSSSRQERWGMPSCRTPTTGASTASATRCRGAASKLILEWSSVLRARRWSAGHCARASSPRRRSTGDRSRRSTSSSRASRSCA